MSKSLDLKPDQIDDYAYYLVYGYCRNYEQSLLENNHIPRDIIDVIFFYFYVMECWQISGHNTEISDDKLTITKKKECYTSSYGSKILHYQIVIKL